MTTFSINERKIIFSKSENSRNSINRNRNKTENTINFAYDIVLITEFKKFDNLDKYTIYPDKFEFINQVTEDRAAYIL